MVVVVMSIEQQRYEGYQEYQQSLRPARSETLGSVAAMLALAAVDLGVSPLAEPERASTHASAEATPQAEEFDTDDMLEIEPIRAEHSRQLGQFAVDSAELGHYDLAA